MPFQHPYKIFLYLLILTLGCSHNLIEVPQNFKEFFIIDDVTANDVLQRNQYRKEKKDLSSIVITDLKLAS